MPEFHPTSDDATGNDTAGHDTTGPRSHRAPRQGLAKRWAIGAAGVAVLAAGLLISPAFGTDDDPAPTPPPMPSTSATPTGAADISRAATPSAAVSAKAARTASPSSASAVRSALVAERLDDALSVVRAKDDKVAAAEAKVAKDDSGTITIVTERTEAYGGSDDDLVSSLLGAIEAEIDVAVVPAAPALQATLDLQPIAIRVVAG